MEDHTQLKNALSNREMKMDIRNNPSIYATPKLTVLKIMAGSQMRPSDMDLENYWIVNFPKPDT